MIGGRCKSWGGGRRLSRNTDDGRGEHTHIHTQNNRKDRNQFSNAQPVERPLPWEGNHSQLSHGFKSWVSKVLLLKACYQPSFPDNKRGVGQETSPTTWPAPQRRVQVVVIRSNSSQDTRTLMSWQPVHTGLLTGPCCCFWYMRLSKTTD